MLVAKQVADLITFTRVLITLLIVWVGITPGDDGLAAVGWLLMLSWTTDVLDGGIARRSRLTYHSWIGDHDLEIDMSVAVGVFIYLLLAGFIPAWLAICYALIWAVIFWRMGMLSGPGKLFQAPIYGYLLVLALQNAPVTGWAMTAWIALAVILTWPRFPQEVIPSFLSGMADAYQFIKRGTS